MSEADVTEQVARREIHGTVNLAAGTAGLYDDRDNYDASGNTFPAAGGSGDEGAILKGDVWTISVAGTLGGTDVVSKDSIRAKVDTPGQIPANWNINKAAGGSDIVFEAFETTQGLVPNDELLANQIDAVISGALPVEFNGVYPPFDIFNTVERYRQPETTYYAYWNGSRWMLKSALSDVFGSLDGDSSSIFTVTSWEALNPGPGIDADNIVVTAVPTVRKVSRATFTAEPGTETLIPTEDDPTVVHWRFNGKESLNGFIDLADDWTLSIDGAADGATGTLLVRQSGGDNTLTLPTDSLVVNGGSGTIAISTTDDQKDILSFVALDRGVGLKFYWTFGKNFTGA